MKKFLLSLALLGSVAGAQAADWVAITAEGAPMNAPAVAAADAEDESHMRTVGVGYCTDEIADNHKALGLPNSATDIAACIWLSPEMLKPYIGQDLQKIRFAIGNGFQTVTAWLREGDDINVNPIRFAPVSDPVEGWNEVEFAEPYHITGEGFFIGYNAFQPKGVSSIWCGGADQKNGMILYAGGEWGDMYGAGYGVLYVQAMLEEEMQEADLVLSNVTLDKMYYESGSRANLNMQVLNNGWKTVDTFTVSYTINGGEPVSRTYGPLLSGKVSNPSFSISLTDFPDDAYAVDVACSIVSPDMQDADEANNKASLTMPVYNESFERTAVLLENFTTLLCPNCPNGHESIKNAIKGRDDIAWVAHHVGYGTDEFTISQSSSYIALGVLGAPSLMLDRRVIEGDAPPMTCGYLYPEQGGIIISGFIEEVKAIPAFASVELSNEFDEATRRLKITVTSECNDLLPKLIPDARLTIFLTENDLTAKRSQAGFTGPYIHDHVLRAVCSPAFGMPVQWEDNKYTQTIEYTLPDTWKAYNMDVTAFINHPLDTADMFNNWVANTATQKVNAVNSIEAIQAGGILRIVGGEISVDGATVADVYTAAGMRVPNSGLQSGLYLVRIVDAQGNARVVKTFVK